MILRALLGIGLLILISTNFSYSSQLQPRLIWEGWAEIPLDRDGPQSLIDYLRLNETHFEKFRQSTKMFRETANDFGNAHNYFGRYEKAMKYYEISLSTAKEMGDLWSEGIVLSNIGSVYHVQGDYEKANALYEQALAISQRFENLKVEGIISGNLGAICHARGEFSKAESLYEKAFEISKRVPGHKHQDTDIKGQGINLGNLAILYRDWGKFSKALETYVKALQIKIRNGDVSGQGATLAEMARIYADWGQHDKAGDHFHKALQKKLASKDKRGQGEVLIMLGSFYAATNRSSDAIEAIQRGMEIWKDMGISTEWPQGMLADIFLEQGQLENAELLTKKNTTPVVKARILLKKGQHDKALNEYRAILESAEKNRKVEDLFVAYNGLASIHESTGDQGLSEKYYQEAFDLTEEMRASIEPDQRARFFEVRVNGFYRLDPYKGLARVKLKTGKTNEAFKITEFAKARIFSESISKRSGQANFNVPEPVVANDLQLNDRLNALKKNRRRALERENLTLAKSLEPQIFQLQKTMASHMEMLRKQYPIYSAAKYPEPVEVQQQNLRGDEWALVYDVGESGLLIFLLHGNTLIEGTFKPAPRKELRGLVRKFREQFEASSIEDLNKKIASFDVETSRKLSQLLIDEFVSKVPANSNIVLVPDDCLALIPFEALLLKNDASETNISGQDDSARKVFFGERNHLSYSPSITSLSLSRANKNSVKSSNRLLVVADPVYELSDERAKISDNSKISSSDAELFGELMNTVEKNSLGNFKFRRLSETGQLATELSKVYAPRVDSLSGMAASKNQLLNSLSSNQNDYSWVVFATHGFFDKDLSGLQEPFLALTMVPPGTDGFLTLSDVMSLKMNADVVVLTSCQSGLGKELSGEGVMSMGRAFQYSGARSVLMSLWSVVEKPSVLLVESFFRNLKPGKNKTEALSLARRELINSGYDHPFFWASFILVGEKD